MKTFSPTIIVPAALALLISSTSTAEAQIRHRNSILRGTQTKQKRRMAKSEKEKKGDVAGGIAGGIETVEIAGIETTDTAMSAPMSISFMSLPSVEVEEDEEEEEKPKPPPPKTPSEPKPPSKKDDIESSPVTEEKSEFGKPLDLPAKPPAVDDETETIITPISNTESSSVMQSTSSACIVGSLVAGALFMLW